MGAESVALTEISTHRKARHREFFGACRLYAKRGSLLFLTLTMLACSHESPVDFVLTPKEPVVTEIPPTPVTPKPPAKATITWDANSESDLAGYKIYYSQSPMFPDEPIRVGLITSYTIENLERGKTYYFSLTAFDTSGNESAKATMVTLDIPMGAR